MGKRTVLLDFDAQGNSTRGLGVNFEHTIYECLTSDDMLEEYICDTEIKNLHVIPANILLANAEIELSTSIGRETILKEKLESLEKAYEIDYMIIDCNPALGLFTVNALTCSNEIIIPISAGIFALEGIEQLINLINIVKKKLNPTLNILGVLVTKYDARTNLSKEFHTELKEIFDKQVFETVIRSNIKLNEAQSAELPIGLYDNKCAGAKEYLDLAKEVIDRMEGKSYAKKTSAKSTGRKKSCKR